MKKLFSLVCALTVLISTDLNAQTDSCEHNLIGVSLTTQIWAAEMSWDLTNLNGDVVASGGNYADYSTYSSQFCLEDGCYVLNLYDTFGDGWNGGTISISYQGLIVASSVFLSGTNESVTFGLNALDCGLLIVGCTDPLAINYDPLASFDDGSCEYDNDSTLIFGCTDWTAINYNPFANIDDGSCEYDNDSLAYGCTDPFAINYDPSATLDDGSCEYNGICVEGIILGAPDGTPVIINTGTFLATAETNNGSFWLDIPGASLNTFVFVEFVDCNGQLQTVFAQFAGACFVGNAIWCEETFGCTDPLAINYDPFATIDDGSCEYLSDSCLTNTISFIFTIGSFASEVSWILYDDNGNTLFEGGDYVSNGTTYVDNICLEDGCYSVEALDSFGDGWNGGVLAVYDGTIPLVEYTLDSGEYGLFSFGVNDLDCQPEILGCTDPLALNYNPFATVDDSTCIYPFSCDSGLIAAQLYVCTFANGNEVGISIIGDNGTIVYEQDGFPTNNIAFIDICLDPEVCYTVNMWNNSGPFGWYSGYYWINYSSGGQIITGALDYGLEEDIDIFSLDGSCFEEVLGCTDPIALNYDPLATIDDGSCLYNTDSCNLEEVTIQMFVIQQTWLPIISLTDDAGTVIFSGTIWDPGYQTTFCLPIGCYNLEVLSVGAGNTDLPLVNVYVNGNLIETVFDTVGDPTDYPFGVLTNDCGTEVFGCTDPLAINYNPSATIDNGSCIYSLSCDSGLVEAQLYVCTFANGNEVGISIIGDDGSVVYEQDGFPTNNIEFIDICLDPEICYTVNMWNNNGPFGWYGGYFWINSLFGSQFITGELGSGTSEGFITFSINGACGDIYGCTDPLAINYNPDAILDDGSCEYDLPVENDLCEDAVPLNPGTWPISNVGAYQNEGMDGDCWGFGAGEAEQTSIWFEITTPAFDVEILILAHSDGSTTLTDTQFGLYTECGTDMIYCDGNSGNGLFSQFLFGCGELDPSTTYLLQVDGWNSDEGTCLLTLEYTNCGSTDIYGCTDPFAMNYDSLATIDDGSCVYDSLGACNAYFEIYYVDETQDIVYIENLSTGSYLSYLWDFGDGTTSSEEFPMHEYGEDGMYTICLTIWSDVFWGTCSQSYCLDVEYNGTGIIQTNGFTINIVPPGTIIGIENVDFIENISVYPNPSSDLFTLEFDGSFNGDVAYDILDISGRLIMSDMDNVIAGRTLKNINVQNFESGVYLMRISSKNAALTTKFSVLK